MLLWNCGFGRDEEPAAKILRLIQIRIATASFEKSWHLVKPIRRKRESPIRVPQARSASVRTRNETLSVVAIASTIQIVRPLESIAETQPQLQAV
jgi:hypothetical protein